MLGSRRRLGRGGWWLAMALVAAVAVTLLWAVFLRPTTVSVTVAPSGGGLGSAGGTGTVTATFPSGWHHAQNGSGRVSPDGTLEVDLNTSIGDCGLGGIAPPTGASTHLQLPQGWSEWPGCGASYVLRGGGNAAQWYLSVMPTSAGVPPGNQWSALDQCIQANRGDLQSILDSVHFSP